MSSVQQAQQCTSHEHSTAWHSTARLHNTKQYSVNSYRGLEAGTLEITNMVALIRLVHIVHWASVNGDLFACASQLHVCYINQYLQVHTQTVCSPEIRDCIAQVLDLS